MSSDIIQRERSYDPGSRPISKVPSFQKGVSPKEIFRPSRSSVQGNGEKEGKLISASNPTHHFPASLILVWVKKEGFDEGGRGWGFRRRQHCSKKLRQGGIRRMSL